MIHLARSYQLLGSKSARLLHEHNDYKVIAFLRADLVFVFSFHPNRSYVDYPVSAPPGEYRMIFNSDMAEYGGHDRLEKDQVHFTKKIELDNFQTHQLILYLPTRTAVILKKQK